MLWRIAIRGFHSKASVTKCKFKLFKLLFQKCSIDTLYCAITMHKTAIGNYQVHQSVSLPAPFLSSISIWMQIKWDVCVCACPSELYFLRKSLWPACLSAESSSSFNIGQSIETENNKEGMFHHFYSGVWINDAVPLPDPVLWARHFGLNPINNAFFSCRSIYFAHWSHMLSWPSPFQKHQT